MPFFLAKTGVSRKTLSFLTGVLLSFYIGIKRFFVYFSPCFSIKTRIIVFCIADLIILFFFAVAERSVNDNACYDNFTIVLS